VTGILNMMLAGSTLNTPVTPGGALTVSASPSSSNGSGPSGGQCPAVTAFVSGGSGSYTYAWSIDTLSLGSLSINNPTGRTTTFNFDTLELGFAGEATVVCSVTDTVTSETGAVNVPVTFIRT
jgi:hypothetical protein